MLTEHVSNGGRLFLLAFFASAGILPCIGLALIQTLPTRSYWLRGSSFSAGNLSPTHSWRRRGALGALDVHCNRIGSAGSKQALAWPKLNESSSPVHVKILAGALPAPDVGALGSLVPPVGKKQVVDFTVQVNDKYRRPLRSGYFTLQTEDGEDLENPDKDGACFALTGDLRINCPSYMHLLPPVAGETVQRLWVTSFGMARAGSVVGIDLTGKLPARRLKTELVWPNAVEHVPQEFLAPLFGDDFDVTASILIADGFLVPGKTDGGVFLVQNPGSNKELSARLTRRDDTRWFYHRAIPFEIQGHKGILTARALKPLSPFQAAQGELVWLEAPNASNPLAPWNVPWREVVVAEGPDVMFEVADLDVTDDTVEVFAAEFFAQRLTMHSIKWDEDRGAPRVVQREVIDDSLGQAYSVAVGNLEGPMSHLLVTTHEYLPVATKGGALSGLGGLGSVGAGGWSYMSDDMAPKDAQEVNGGSLFAYRIPTAWRRRADGYVAGEDAYRKMLPEMFRRIDVDASGQISVEELEASLSWLRVRVTPLQLRAAFQDADWDDSGSIDYKEFERILLSIRSLPEANGNKEQNALTNIGKALGSRIISKSPGAAANELQALLQQAAAAAAAAPTLLQQLQQLPAAVRQLQQRAAQREREDRERERGTAGPSKAGGQESSADTEPSVGKLFEQLDTDADGLLTPLQVREVCITVWRDSNSSRNVWGILALALESLVMRGTASDAAADLTWTRTTLATGFSVKRAGINPGAPGFVYPFYPHKAMARGSAPPHLLVAGDCSDAAYIFRPVRSGTVVKKTEGEGDTAGAGPSVYGPWVETDRKGVNTKDKWEYLYPGQPAQVNLDFRYPVTTGDTGQIRYELLATFGCEGTVGSVAVGNVDTLQSVDDGWVKFFLPVYEKDRVFMLKCGDPPTMGYLADDDW